MVAHARRGAPGRSRVAAGKTIACAATSPSHPIADAETPMIEVFPAILTDAYDALERMVRAAERFAPFLQIDITDGRFVPSTSVSSADVRSAAPRIPFELHLMIRRPEDALDDYLACGAKRIIIHQSSSEESEALVSRIRSYGIDAGLAVSPGADLEKYSSLLPSIQQVTFCAVDLGFQGGTMIPGVLQLVRSFHHKHPAMPLEIDGGIKLANIEQMVATGATRFVIGSAIWNSSDPQATYQSILERFQRISSPSTNTNNE
jgi:ribulose-phosphate 3-epimerase